MESLRTKFEEHLTCAICLEHFKDPKVLPCLHFYCHECIVKLDKTGNNITCPECRRTVEVGDPPDISFLPSNFFVKNLLATLSLASESDDESVVCENCDSEDPAAVTRCEQCNKYLCQFCTVAHKRIRDTKDHILKSIEELKASVPSMIAETVRCPKHKDEVRLYCITCQETICRDCAIVDHRQHDFSFVEDVAQEKKDELKKLVAVVEERKKEVSEGLEKVTNMEESVQKQNESTVAEINKHFENLAKAIDIKRNELIEETNDLCDAKQKQLYAQREELETTLASCESNIEFTEQAFKNGNDVQILNMKKYISQSLETLQNTKSQIQPCADSYIEFVAEFSENKLTEKLDRSLSVVDEQRYPENYSACFTNSNEKWLKVGKKYEITIRYKSIKGKSRVAIDGIKPVFTGVPVKDVSVTENVENSYNVNFVPREVGVVKFELFVNGRSVPHCGLRKAVKWELKSSDAGTSSSSFSVGDCVFESGIHTWKINVDHSDCKLSLKVDFKVGIVNYDTVNSVVVKDNRCGLDGFTRKSDTCDIKLKLDMSEKKLFVTPSWGLHPTTIYEVNYSTVAPVYSSGCSECKISVTEMGPFSFEVFNVRKPCFIARAELGRARVGIIFGGVR